MSADLNLFSEDGDDESPFDAIRRIRPDGTEFWSARDLMPLLGYDQWRNFERCINEARRAAEIAGASDQFADSGKLIETGKGAQRAIADVHLTRYAAYMVAMSCDGRKSEVASAKTYFAIRTREAEVHARDIGEVASVKPLSGLEYALALVDAERRAAAGAKFQRAIEGGDGIGLRVFHKKYFSSITEKAFFSHLYGKNYLIDQRGKGSMRDSGPRAGTFRDGSQHSHPSFKGKPWLYLHTPETFNGYRKEQTRVRPGRYELDFRDHLAAEGLAANENTTGLFGIDGTVTRELSA